MEISAQELRIGNLIYSLGQKHKDGRFLGWVNHEIKVDLDVLQNINSENTDFKYSPIPLTEEWLFTLGFDKKQHNMGICYTLGDFEVYISKTHGFCINYNGVFIKSTFYVHSLQNLYFALTGEELTIKQHAKI